MTQLALAGVHHVVIPVTDLNRAVEWWARAFHAEHLTRLDHVDDHGQRFAAVVRLPGDAPLVQLLLSDELAQRTAGCAPIAFRVAARDELAAWAQHFDAESVPRTRIREGLVGDTFEVTTAYGLVIKLYAPT